MESKIKFLFFTQAAVAEWGEEGGSGCTQLYQILHSEDCVKISPISELPKQTCIDLEWSLKKVVKVSFFVVFIFFNVPAQKKTKHTF